MKNHVGRPTNEEVRARKNKKILMAGIVIVAVLAVIGAFEIGNFSNLMGNSVTGDNYEIVRYKAYAIGDVNKDGKINIADAESIQKYVADLEIYDDYQKLLADVNKDGNVDMNDQVILRKYISGYSSGSLGAEHSIGRKACLEGSYKGGYCTRKVPVSNNDTPNKIVYGDVNSDGLVNVTDKTILSGYISDIAGYKLNETELKAADLNLDGKVDISDYTILEGYFDGEITELPHPSQLFGDINFDGMIDVTDETLLNLYIGNSTKNNLSDAQKHVADLNLDGLVDGADQTIMQQYLNGSITKLPYIK